MSSLKDEFKKYQTLSAEGELFLENLEHNIAADLWGSAGGHWSQASIDKFREIAMQKMADYLKENSDDFQASWNKVVRDFHSSYWGEQRLQKKEKRPRSEESKTFWELFSYFWVLIQASLITKTIIMYFGIRNTEEEAAEGRIYVILAMLFTFGSLMFFAIRKTKGKKNND